MKNGGGRDGSEGAPTEPKENPVRQTRVRVDQTLRVSQTLPKFRIPTRPRREEGRRRKGEGPGNYREAARDLQHFTVRSFVYDRRV